jgi:hypothetical protein
LCHFTIDSLLSAIDDWLVRVRGEKNLSVPRRSQADLCGPKRTDTPHAASTSQISTDLLKIQAWHGWPARCNVSRFNDATRRHPIQLSKILSSLFALKSQIANQKSQIRRGFLLPSITNTRIIRHTPPYVNDDFEKTQIPWRHLGGAPLTIPKPSRALSSRPPK